MNTEKSNVVTADIHDAEHGHGDLKSYGLWLYLMSDLVIFSLLFATFVVLGKNYAGGPGPKELFELPYLFIETMFLLLSSFTYGFGMISMQKNNQKGLIISLIITALLGLGFIGMELNEFSVMIAEGFGPSKSAFLSSFFTLVGTHGLHVSIGLLWMIVLIVQLFTKGLYQGTRSRLMLLGLFWHFLDIVWIGVFTVVYLMGIV